MGDLNPISYEAFISLSQQADESLNFEEQILEAARAITGAAGALVKAAASAQRELVASGRVSIGRNLIDTSRIDTYTGSLKIVVLRLRSLLTRPNFKGFISFEIGSFSFSFIWIINHF